MWCIGIVNSLFSEKKETQMACFTLFRYRFDIHQNITKNKGENLLECSIILSVITQKV